LKFDENGGVMKENEESFWNMWSTKTETKCF